MSYDTTLITVSILNGEFRLEITLKLIKVEWLNIGMMIPQGTPMKQVSRSLEHWCKIILLTLIFCDVLNEQRCSSEP